VLAALRGALPAAPDQFVVLERHVEVVHDDLAREISVLGRR
jgi:hypothetical protein